MENTEQVILKLIEINGIDAAKEIFFDKPNDIHTRQLAQEIFDNLEQKAPTGEAKITLKEQEKIAQAIKDHQRTLDGLAKR